MYKLERLLNAEWPGKDFTVHAFGSSENLLATKHSDRMNTSIYIAQC